MSTLVDKMDLRNTGNRVCDFGPLEIVTRTFSKPARFTNDFLYEWRIDVTLGCVVTGTSEDIQSHVDLRVKPMIEHTIFGEFERDLYEIKHAAYNRDFEKVEELVNKIHGNMFTYRGK